MCHRATHTGATVQFKPHPKTPASQAQAAERQRMKDARESFKRLNAEEIADWNLAANEYATPAWMLFFKEWQAQNIPAGSTPLVPKKYI